MEKYKGISIVIPLYGDFEINRILKCIDSIKMQKGVDKEIVVSEQGEIKRFPDIEEVKHIFTYHKPQANLSDFNPGKVRNIAILNSTKDYVYTIDADVIFPDPNFLKKLLKIIKKNPNKVLYRPFMRRLPLDNFSEFNKWCDSLGFEKALKKLIINQKFLAKTSSKYKKMKIFEKDSKEAGYRKTFTSLIKDYNRYIKERLGSDNDLNFWPVYWNENRHCGSNFFKRSQFLEIGGYCEKFINWGCEDSDLQWKFRETYKLEFFPPKLEVIHLDHPKRYISPKMWGLNEKKSSKRKKDGVESAIKYDKKILEKRYGKE